MRLPIRLDVRSSPSPPALSLREREPESPLPEGEG
jgi:hypothetical protein